MPTFLVCPPDYYGIEYEINPWMDKSRGTISSLAKTQWDALYNLLTQKLSVTVQKLNPISGFPDLVFTANAGLVVGNHFFSSRFRHSVRQGESAHYEKWFRERHFQIHFSPENICFEGEGDALFVGDQLFLGYDIRTDLDAAGWLEEVLHQSVHRLELTDPHFYHLDTCFCPLDHERVLYYPPAFSTASQEMIKRFVPKPIAIKESDALQFGANAIVIRNQIVMNAGCADLAEILTEEGFRVHALDFSEFIKSGGSAKCLILQIPDSELIRK